MSIFQKSPLERSEEASPRSQRLSLENSKISVRPGDNWLVLGRKGSGKTTAGKLLVNHLSQMYPKSRIYVLDIKLRDFNDWPGIVKGDNTPNKPHGNQRVQVWQPVVLNPDNIERWLYMIRHDPPAILEVDELLALCYGRRDTSEEFTRITKLGRALPVGTIVHTQDLVEIPRGVISQPDHIMRFRLKHPYEIRLASNLMSNSQMSEPVDKYGFYYSFAEKDGEAHYYPDIQSFLGYKK